MGTEVVPMDATRGPWPELERLAAIVRDGGLVAFPTETVYGIAVNARDESAIRRLHQAKGRDANKPLTIHLSSQTDLVALVRELSPPARRMAARFWPGPLTLVIPDRHRRPTGYRVPSLPIAREFIRLTNVSVAATSANPSGSPPAETAEEVLEAFDGVVDAIIDGGPCPLGTASSVVRVIGPDVEILREGGIAAARIREAAAHTLLFVCSGNRCRSPFAEALATRMLAKRLGARPAQLVDRGYRIHSAGTDCVQGDTATSEAETIAAQYGLDLSEHRSRPLTPSLVEGADEIYVMTAAHRRSILDFSPESRGRVRLLDKRDRDIGDPFGHGSEAYAEMAGHVHRSLQARLDDF